ncbi:aldo/keto reductase [Acidimicrobiia bacterium]|jgi:voltage-dependent potassium channel beta subunit|nr:aldo/keto reductase [Acidimicrobiia bacterium]
MEHRKLGTSGLKLSTLSFGSWVTFDQQLNDDAALECLQTAWDAGVTFFDNAEGYAAGESEKIMGRCFQNLGWERNTYTVSTKFYWGLTEGPNTRFTLNRKYLMSAIDASLDRLKMDFVDLIFCHRADPDTPMEEIVWAMSDIIASGRALYWGTSEWSAEQIREAWEVADKLNLRKPVMEQPEYHLLQRDRVEKEYAPLYGDLGIGLTTWSPLASGLLTGKYSEGIPQDSRGSLPGYEFLKNQLTDKTSIQKVENLKVISDEIGCSLAQLAIAWCTLNKNVSTVITGASRVEQVRENLASLEVAEQIDEELIKRIEFAVT